MGLKPTLALSIALLGWVQPGLAQDGGREVVDRAESQRRDLRAQQNVLTRPESNQADRRLDAIENRARTNPGAAQDMLRIYQQDQSLNTINRPIPGAPPPQAGGMVGPGDKH